MSISRLKRLTKLSFGWPLLFFLMLISSCASSKNFVHPAGDSDKMELDRAQCEYEANKHAGDLHSGGMGGCIGISFMMAHEDRKTQLFEQCMRARGYKVKE